MAMHDQPVNVTVGLVGVSNDVMNMAWCDHASELRHSTTSAVLWTY